MMGAGKDQNLTKDATNAPAASERLWTPANVVTLVRICLVPVFVLAIISPWPAYFGLDASSAVKSWVAALIFIVLAATDGLDGYLARSRGEVTDFGKFMDPLADKILVAAALLSLIELGVLPSWPALIILTVAASKGTVIAASWYGKAKTVTQIIAIVLFIIKDTVVEIDPLSAIEDPLYLISWAFMIVAVVLTIVSMLDYFVKARHLLGFSSSDGGKGAESSASDVETIASDCAPSDDSVSPAAEALAASVREAARRVIEKASHAGVSLGTAESLTGGLIAGSLTAVPGSSSVVRGGIVSYVDEVKRAVLDVPDPVLETVGAVSRETARAMAEGAVARLSCDIAVSVTGIAGPGGAEPGKPVGTVWMGVCRRGAAADARLLSFRGDREQVRLQTVLAALEAFEGAIGG